MLKRSNLLAEVNSKLYCRKEDVISTFLKSLRETHNLDVTVFARLIRLVRSRLFLLSLNVIDDFDESVTEPEESYPLVLDKLLNPLISFSLWRTAINSYNLLRCQYIPVCKKKNQKKFIQSRDLSKQVNVKYNSDIIALQNIYGFFNKIEEIEEHQTCANINKVKYSQKISNPIDKTDLNTSTFFQYSKKKNILSKNVRFLSHLSLVLINHYEQTEFLNNDRIKMIKNRCSNNLDNFK